MKFWKNLVFMARLLVVVGVTAVFLMGEVALRLMVPEQIILWTRHDLLTGLWIVAVVIYFGFKMIETTEADIKKHRAAKRRKKLDDSARGVT